MKYLINPFHSRLYSKLLNCIIDIVRFEKIMFPSFSEFIHFDYLAIEFSRTVLMCYVENRIVMCIYELL